MKTFLIYSFCKVNLSLRVIAKLRTGLHKIQSIVTFVNLFDIIKIKEINSEQDQIKFYGKFKHNINLKDNTISKTLDLLRKNNYLKKKKFKIYIKKNIPHSAGLGGGSMNSAALIKFFLSTYKLNINQKKLYKIANKIGSDVSLGLKIRNTFLIGGKKYPKRFEEKLKLHVVLVNPGIKCLSKNIYSRNKLFSKPYNKKREDPYIIDSLGWGMYLTGRYEEAEKFLQKAVQLMPLDPIVNDHYADILWKLNRNLQANYFWNYVLDLETTENQMKDKIKEKLIFRIQNNS